METIHNTKRIKRINSYMEKFLKETPTISKRELYDQYQDVINEVEATDLLYLDLYKQNSEATPTEIKETAGKFVNVFYHSLSIHQPKTYDSVLFNHFIKENKAIEEFMDTIKPFFNKSIIESKKDILLSSFERCMELERKYIKKENILFPKLENKIASTKPLEVLWSLHDDARRTLKELLIELRKDTFDIDTIITLIGDYYYFVYGLNQKEELILLPIADKLLSIEDKNKMYNESLEFGYVFIEQTANAFNIKEEPIEMNGMFTSKTGSLKLEEVGLIFSHLPLDITFVDKDDKVKYFNDRKERHFPRNPSIIGRLVKHCHPPKSVQVVEDIVSAFKNNERDEAEFYIEFNKSFLYITYYAVRNELNEYQGTLEVSQDVTGIRSLQGQKRLLDWK